jgi:hypothetical protein
MSENEILLSSLKGFFASVGIEEKADVPNRFSIWYDRKHELEIMLPAKELINHPQSDELLSDTISKIAKSHGYCSHNFKSKLLNSDSDLLQVRTSGERINHGRINFNDGLNALTGLYGIIKSSASKNIKAKGKREAVKKYLSAVNMLAPKAGSFIYTVELELINIDDNNDSDILKQSMSLSRYVNSNLALTLERVAKKIRSHDLESPAKLLNIGIDSSFCNNFLDLFSKNSDKLEFDFDWSFKESIPDNVPSKVAFNYQDRMKIEHYQKILHNSKAHKYVDLPAYIEKYSWPIEDENGRVYLRLEIDGKDYTCFIETDSVLYETLKAEHAKKQISITCELLITSGRKKSIDIIKVYSLKLNENLEIEMDM